MSNTQDVIPEVQGNDSIFPDEARRYAVKDKGNLGQFIGAQISNGSIQDRSSSIFIGSVTITVYL